jgi:hypothetical protein
MANFDFAVVKCAVLSNGKADKNGLESLILDAVAGKVPKNRVMSGTIADRQGFEPNKAYMISIEQLPSNEYGEQFRFTNLGQLNGLELMKTCKELGKGIVVETELKETGVKAFSNVVPDAALV